MAPWGDSKLFFCILFITCCCCTVTFAQIPMDCCLHVIGNIKIDKHNIVDYRRQTRGHGCSIDAMIVVTRNGRNLCAPADDTPWLRGVVKHVKGVKKFCKKHNYKVKRCNGVNA